MLKKKMSCSNKNVSVLDMDVVGGLSKVVVVFFARLLNMGDIAGWVDIGLGGTFLFMERAEAITDTGHQ